MPKRKPKDPERSPDLPHNWIERHFDRVAEWVYYDPVDLTTWEYRRSRLIAPGKYEPIDDEWRLIHLGETWGGADITAFFRKKFVIPTGYDGPDVMLDIFMDGGETQLSIDGEPWQGLDWHRSLVPLGKFAQSGREVELSMEAFIINYPYDERRHDERELHYFERARLLKRDPLVENFLFDARLVLDAYLSYYHTDDNFEIEGFLRHHLENVCRALGPQFTNRAQVNAAVSTAHRLLKQTVFADNAYQSPGQINLCAHSHLDIIYLWPIKETLRKNCRTATNMLSLMREFPDYRFSYSQPYLYEDLKERYPTVYQEIKRRVREGRWEVIGAMYVEPDGNLLGAESLVRQILFGKRFIRQEFGLEAETCWLPDVFGVMYTLPQILRKSGVKYFLTAKLNIWNDTNNFPYDTFRWRGPDGSEVLTHFPPTHFGQPLNVTNLRRHWQDYRQQQTAGENLFIYGWADGGGGPTRDMVAAGFRTADLPGLPAVQVEFAETFFHRVANKANQLPVWDDELYMEGHRGTYTTKGDLKRQNRKAELLYRDAEIVSALAGLFGGAYTQTRLNEGWKWLLLNQFHDTLPGTHKPAGVPDIKATYKKAFGIGYEVRDQALAALRKGLAAETIAANDLLVVNTLSWSRTALVGVTERKEARSVRLAGGQPQPVQHYANKTWLKAEMLPSLGWTVANFDDTFVFDSELTAKYNNDIIETPLYRLTLNEAGNLQSIFDKTNRRAVLTAPGNVLQLFEDDPGHKFSAWDIAYHFEEYQYPVTQTSAWELVANGPLFAVFKCEWQALDSVIEQEMWLYAHNPRIDFHTRAVWRNQRKLLKVAFPLQVRSRTATYDLPFGHIERPTHRNTTWEQAKFEVNGHKWADLSEGDYGVALMNDCKYGYDVRENVLRLSLLRSPVRPDGGSDQGEHQFSYALLPHAGSWRQAHVDRRAYEFNIPAITAPLLSSSESTRQVPAEFSLLQIDSRSLMVETLKQAENEGQGLILRTFDSHGSHANTEFAAAVAMQAVAETDLLEENPEQLSLTDVHHFTTAYTPYEIKTHRLEFDM